MLWFGKKMIIIRRFTKHPLLLFLCLQIISLAASCTLVADNGPKQDNLMVSEQDIDKVLKDHGAELLAIPGVEGAARGICGGNLCLKFYVSRESPDLEERLEAIIGALPFEIEKSGSFQPF
jgi:hypothetical protein